MATVKNQARQGDIFFQKSGSLPSTAKKRNERGEIVLAYGEVTGHSHRVSNWKNCDMATDTNGDIYVRSKTNEPINIVHDEHGEITLDGSNGEWFCISRQREYDVFAEREERRVAD